MNGVYRFSIFTNVPLGVISIGMEQDCKAKHNDIPIAINPNGIPNVRYFTFLMINGI